MLFHQLSGVIMRFMLSKTTFSRSLGISCCLLLVSVSRGWAQAIQLPTVRSFGASTTVLIPDRVPLVKGGNYSGYASRPFPRNNTMAGISVTAQIFDHKAMDLATLKEAHRRRASRGPGTSATHSVRRARRLSSHIVNLSSVDGNESSWHRNEASTHQHRAPISSVDASLSHAELMRRGRQAMQQRSYRLAKEYFLAAARK